MVTNPTHLAIALGYEKGVDKAPYILGMEKIFLAEQMIKLAKQYDVPVVRNIKLAHRLWEQGEVYEYVPEETYEAVQRFFDGFLLCNLILLMSMLKS